jgi:hypothetical protein
VPLSRIHCWQPRRIRFPACPLPGLYDYAKAGEISTITGSFDTTYRAPEFRWNVTADVNSTKDPEQGTIDRDSLGFTYQWLLQRQRFISGLSLRERNEETGIDARAQLGAAYGKYFRQTSKSELSAMLGPRTDS